VRAFTSIASHQGTVSSGLISDIQAGNSKYFTGTSDLRPKAEVYRKTLIVLDVLEPVIPDQDADR
jgi:hypothetical protein